MSTSQLLGDTSRDPSGLDEISNLLTLALVGALERQTCLQPDNPRYAHSYPKQVSPKMEIDLPGGPYIKRNWKPR